VEVAQDEGGGVEVSPSKRRIDGPKSSVGLAKFRGSLDLGGGARRLNPRRGENLSRCVSVNRGWRARTTCTSKSRSAISRFDRDRRSECGQVAQI
jgi:hypothetical protein